MRKALLALALFLVAGTATARDFYFSTCRNAAHPSGCTSSSGSTSCHGCYDSASIGSCPVGGSAANPLCPDPDGNGTRESFSYLSDGTGTSAAGTEVQAGDTIHLCDDRCDGAGTGTIFVHQTNSAGGNCGSNFLRMIPAGSAGNVIKIKEYTGEQVTLQGDTNDDRVYQPGPPAEVNTMIANTGHAGTNPGYWTFEGFTIKRTKGNAVCADHDNYNQGGFPNTIFDGITITEADNEMWTTAAAGGIGAATNVDNEGSPPCGSGSQGAYCMYISRNSGPTTIQNSTISHCCHSAVRYISGRRFDGASLLVQNSAFSDATTSVEAWDVAHVDLFNNTISDVVYCVQLEDRVTDVEVKGNTCTFPGLTIPSANGRATGLVKVSDGDSTGVAGLTSGVYIHRNKFMASNVGGSPANRGTLNGGITFTADCRPDRVCDYGPSDIPCSSDADCSPPAGSFGNYCNQACTSLNGVIENNMFSGVNSAASGVGNGNQITRSAISVQSNQSVTVQNNTIHNSRYAIQLDDGASGFAGTPEHVVKNNIVEGCSGDCITVLQGMTGSGIDFNNVRGPTTNSLVFCSSGGTVGTNCVVDTLQNRTCANFKDFGTGNKCQQTEFQNPSTLIASNNLHLKSIDPASDPNRNAGTTGATLDYDGETRPFQDIWDLGADESIASILPDFGFESGALCNVVDSWCGGTSISLPVCASPQISTGSSLYGTYALVMQVGSCSPACNDPGWDDPEQTPCQQACGSPGGPIPFSCPSGDAFAKTIEGRLQFNTPYSLSGHFRVSSGSLSAADRIQISARDCSNDLWAGGNATPITCGVVGSCSIEIGAVGQGVTFVCPDLFQVPSLGPFATGIYIVLHPSFTNSGVTVSFDNIALYATP